MKLNIQQKIAIGVIMFVAWAIFIAWGIANNFGVPPDTQTEPGKVIFVGVPQGESGLFASPSMGSVVFMPNSGAQETFCLAHDVTLGQLLDHYRQTNDTVRLTIMGAGKYPRCASSVQFVTA